MNEGEARGRKVLDFWWPFHMHTGNKEGRPRGRDLEAGLYSAEHTPRSDKISHCGWQETFDISPYFLIPFFGKKITALLDIIYIPYN